MFTEPRDAVPTPLCDTLMSAGPIPSFQRQETLLSRQTCFPPPAGSAPGAHGYLQGQRDAQQTRTGAQSPAVSWKTETELRAAQGAPGLRPRGARSDPQTLPLGPSPRRPDVATCPLQGTLALLSTGWNPERSTWPTRQMRSVWEAGGNPERWRCPWQNLVTRLSQIS